MAAADCLLKSPQMVAAILRSQRRRAFSADRLHQLSELDEGGSDSGDSGVLSAGAGSPRPARHGGALTPVFSCDLDWRPCSPADEEPEETSAARCARARRLLDSYRPVPLSPAQTPSPPPPPLPTQASVRRRDQQVQTDDVYRSEMQVWRPWTEVPLSM